MSVATLRRKRIMLRKLGLIGILLVLSAAVGTPAWAQVQTGSIFVKVTDEQGAAVPGVTLTVTSPVLPRPLTAVTDSQGVHRFASLSLGTYSVQANLAGFQTVTRPNVVVLQNETVTLDFAMKVGAVTEVLTVTGESPVVDAKTAAVNVNLDSMLLDTTPGGKDIWNILEYKIPGLIFDTPDVGGNQAGLQRSFSSRGTPNAQNVQMVNGVNVGDPGAIGFSMNYYEASTFENVQVTTGAQDISMGTSGTLINMVTRSGTNRFGGQVLGTYQGKGTQWDNIDEDLKQKGFRPEAQAVGYISNVNGQAGGPILANRLFYFANLQEQRTHVNVPGYPAISPPQIPAILSGNTQDTTDIASMSGKLTYALGSSNRFEGYSNRQWYDKPNRGAGASVTLDSNTKEYDTFVISQMSWNSVLTDRLFADTKLAYSNTHFPLTQKTDLQSILDNSTGVRHRNSANSGLRFRRRLQFTSNWNYYLSSLFGGRHEFKFGFDNGYTPEDVTISRVDDVNLTFRSRQGNANQPPGAGNVTIFNSPVTTKPAVMNTAIYGQDSFAIGRLTVIGGIRWERVEGYIREQVHPSPPSQYFPAGLVISGLNVSLNTGGRLTEYVVPERFAEVRNAPLWKNWAPRASATYDLFSTGKTVAKFSIGKYLDQIGTGTPGPNPNGTVSQTYGWNDQDGDLSFDRGNAVWNGTRYVGGEFGTGNVTTSIPNPNPFDTSLKRTWRREITAGIDHELLPAFRLSVTFINRRTFDPQGDRDVNFAIWDQVFSRANVSEPGRDGRFGTADDQVISVYTLNPGFTLSDVTVNDDRFGTRYDGVEIIGTKRYGRGTTLLAGYTYAHQRIDLTDLQDPNESFINVEGPTGRRHAFKASGSMMLPYRILLGVNYRIQSGLPITRTYTVPGCSSTVTVDCLPQGNTTINMEPRGSVNLPALSTLDFRAGRLFDVRGQRFELSMDFYNVANSNTVFNVRSGSTLTDIRYANDPTQPIQQIQTFLSPTGILGPRIIRFNVTYWFGPGSSNASRR
jgi:hypothetical protein